MQYLISNLMVKMTNSVSITS